MRHTRGVILHGNTGDLTSDPEAPGQWTALPTALMNLLRQRGYQHVVSGTASMVLAALMRALGIAKLSYATCNERSRIRGQCL